MTDRLNNAIRPLSPRELEQVAEFAERLALRHTSGGPQRKLKLDWVGTLADAYPEHTSGVDAAHEAAKAWRESVGRELQT